MGKPIVTRVILSGVIIKDGKALILKRSSGDAIFPGLWEIPGGKKGPGEDWESALKREIKEETDLTIKPLYTVNVFSYLVETENDIRDATQINFLAKIEGGKLRISKEHESYAWVDEEDLDKYRVSPSTKKVIKAAFKLTAQRT